MRITSKSCRTILLDRLPSLSKNCTSTRSSKSDRNIFKFHYTISILFISILFKLFILTVYITVLVLIWINITHKHFRVNLCSKKTNHKKISITYSQFIFFVDLYSFISFTSYESWFTVVKCWRKDPSLRVNRARLDSCLKSLKIIAWLPIPQVHCSVVACKQLNRVVLKNASTATVEHKPGISNLTENQAKFYKLS